MDKLITAVKSILETTITAAKATGEDYQIAKIKSIFWWDPIIFPTSNLPALVIMPRQSDVTARGVWVDQADRSFQIKYIQSIGDTVGADKIDPEKIVMYEEACKLFEMSESDKISIYSIVWALRKNPKFTVDNVDHADWNGNYSINYEFTNIRGYIAFETTLTIMCKKLSDRNRS